MIGSPYVAPSEIVQKIMQRLREHENHEHDPHAVYNSYEQYNPLYCDGTFSVLSPDNRQFLERPRSKSPDMRNKRMIIGKNYILSIFFIKCTVFCKYTYWKI